ncbi:MAG: exodeoxyribonuclease III [Clostridia bacterium]|nr:exodeoxyribonuclease III [Clostridia bacterium]
MKLISWNVNGLRACLKKNFHEFFEQEQADIFCLQETKLQEGQVEMDLPGYYQYWDSAVKKGYSGTAVFSRIKPVAVRKGMGVEEHDQEGRMLTLEYTDFILVNVYVPNSQPELARLNYRLQWQDAFKNYISNLTKPVIICGDLNVAHQEIDLKNPKSNRRSAGFTEEERNKLSELLAIGLKDSYRYFYPDLTGKYTWWSYMRKSRERNAGWRIDYFLFADSLTEQVEDAVIYADILGSDHCPVGLLLKD